MTRLFYSVLLYMVRFELALAKAAPNRNYPYISRLKADEEVFSGIVDRQGLGI